MPYQVTEPGGKVVEKMLAVGNYKPAFLACGIACVIAAVVVVIALKPAKPSMPAGIAAMKGELDGAIAKEPD